MNYYLYFLNKIRTWITDKLLFNRSSIITKYNIKPENNRKNETEYILNKYIDGADVFYCDLDKIHELRSIGLIRTGMSFKREKITAKTTLLGRKMIGKY
jgi:hypothetical protein